MQRAPISEFSAAAQNHSEKDVLQFDAGTAAYKAGKYEQASEDFQKSLDVKPSADPKQLAAQQDAYYNLGNTLYRTGQKTAQGNVQQTIQTWEQSVKSYDAALQLRADDADAKFNRDLVQRKLDALKKQQQQQQKQQDQKQKQQDQQKNQQQNQSQSQNQNQGQQDKNQQSQSGQGSSDKNNTANKGTDQQKPSEGQQPQNQANNGSQSNQGQPQNSGQQPGQKPTAQNPGSQQGQGSKPDQQQSQQANGGTQNGPSQTPQPQPGQQSASGTPGGGTSVAQNGTPPNSSGQASEQGTPGEMSKQEARQLLDSLRDEQRQMPGNPVGRGGNDNSPDQPVKDW
jgi:Ca-activated chloride channel family protein